MKEMADKETDATQKASLLTFYEQAVQQNEEAAAAAATRRGGSDTAALEQQLLQMEKQQEKTAKEMARLKRAQEDETEWQRDGSKKQHKRLMTARNCLEDLDDYLKTELAPGSKAGAAMKKIIDAGAASIDADLLNIKLADKHGWAVVEEMGTDEVLVAAKADNIEELDKKLASAKKRVEAARDSSKKKQRTGTGTGGGKGGQGKGGRGWQQWQQQRPQAPLNGCWQCGGNHYESQCPMPPPQGPPPPLWGGKGGKGGKGF
jgi:hypothetical protein